MFSFPYTPQGVSLESFSALNVFLWEGVLDGTALVERQVTIPAGAWQISAAITNPEEFLVGEAYEGGALKWTDSTETLRELPAAAVQLDRKLVQVGDGVVAYPETRIVFPVGAKGVVAVMAPLGFVAPNFVDVP